MSPKNRYHSKEIIDRTLREYAFRLIEDFLNNSDEMLLTFPSSLTKDHRAFIHQYVRDCTNLMTRTFGKPPNRSLKVYKPPIGTRQETTSFSLSKASEKAIFRLLKENPLRHREVIDLDPNEVKAKETKMPPFRVMVGVFVKESICVPPLPNFGTEMRAHRENLPIFRHRDGILRAIRANQILMVTSESGCGKTTQLPQYVLEDCAACQRVCRIVCIQPQRLATISVAERIAFERGERIATTVGYQIRLESKTSPTSNLSYCTNEIFLRCLIGQSFGDVFLSVTHVIVDELNEQDKYNDLLLILLRRAVQTYKHLKLILLSAAIDGVEQFSEYFFNCPILKIPKAQFQVESLYLEEILPAINYKNCNTKLLNENCLESSVKELSPEVVAVLDKTLEKCFNGTPVAKYFDKLFYLVQQEKVSVDYRHSITKMTGLMIAVTRGYREGIKILHDLGANPHLTDLHGYNAFHLANVNSTLYNDLIFMYYNQQSSIEGGSKEVVEGYYKSIPNSCVDYELIFAILRHIFETSNHGSIFVFLPGYEEISDMYDRIGRGKEEGEIAKYMNCFMVHSNMSVIDLRDAMNNSPNGYRKVILSTCIAETSMTIRDVDFVIDSGRTYRCAWISQQSSAQRALFAGRSSPGKSFHLYTRAKMTSFQKTKTPEILNASLSKICLLAKFIAPSSSIADFLSQAIQPPGIETINHYVELLTKIGALDKHENVTELGALIVDIPVDVQLGKVLVYSIFMQCLDPILSIVSSLCVKDAFSLPVDFNERAQALHIRKQLSENTFSDHLVLLKVFQKYLDSKLTKSERTFCEDNFIVQGNVQQISTIRSQILGIMRAIKLIQHHGPGNISDLNRNSSNWAVVKSCLVAGLYPNISHITPNRNEIQSYSDKGIVIHPLSILHDSILASSKPSQFPSNWLVSSEKQSIHHVSTIKTNTAVTPITIALFAGPIRQDEKSDLITLNRDNDSLSDYDENGEKFTCLTLDEWISFNLLTTPAYLVFYLRRKMNALFLKFVHEPETFFRREKQSPVILTVIDVLTREDLDTNFIQPDRIGNRPHAVINQPIRPRDFDMSSMKQCLADTSISSEISTSSTASSFSNQNWNFNPRSQRRDGQHSTRVQQTTTTSLTEIKTKYFIVKAASRHQVWKTFGSNNWDYSTSILKSFIRILRTSKSVELIIFFHVVCTNEMVGAAQFKLAADGFVIEGMTHSRVSVSAVRRHFRNHPQVKSIDRCYDGEELSSSVGEQMLSLLGFNNRPLKHNFS